MPRLDLARAPSMLVLGWLLVATFAGDSSAATIVTDADDDVSAILGLSLGIAGSPTGLWDVTYVFGTYEDVFGAGSSALPSGWPVDASGELAGVINAIANALDANGVGNTGFTNGVADGSGSAKGLVPYFVGPTGGCDWCVAARGVYYSSPASGWSPDGADTSVRTAITTSASGFVQGPEVTWAVVTPVPEPGPSLLVAAGILGLVCLQQGRHRCA